jgi:3-oxoacyl-[acyl-carrier-protein] synthase III
METSGIPLSGARITAMSAHVPEQVLTNAHLRERVDTDDDWIVQRTGIHERRVASTDEYASDLCLHAVEDLQSIHGVTLEDVDHILVASMTSDYAFPSMASILQYRLHIPHAGAVDISAACAGFVEALILANAMVSSGTCRKVLVVAGEVLSKRMDYTDRSSCILFGDGAGAALVERSDQGGFLATDSQADGSHGIDLYCTALRPSIGDIADTTPFLHQNGRAVYRWATSMVPSAVDRLLGKASLTIEKIDWFIPHSANMRIIESVCKSIGIEEEKTLHSVQYLGNTGAASIPLAMVPAIRDGRLKPGDTVLLLGFGGGLLWSGAILRY